MTGSTRRSSSPPPSPAPATPSSIPSSSRRPQAATSRLHLDPDVESYWQEYWALILTFNRRFAGYWGCRHPTPTRVERDDPGHALPVAIQPALRLPQRLGSQPVPERRRPSLQGDRPHMFGSGQLPAAVGDQPQHHDQPAERPALRPPDRGAHPGPAGDDHGAGEQQRHDFQYQWDLNVGKRFPLGKDVDLQLDLQILNVLNDTPTDWWETVVLSEGDDFVPNTWSSRAVCSCTWDRVLGACGTRATERAPTSSWSVARAHPLLGMRCAHPDGMVGHSPGKPWQNPHRPVTHKPAVRRLAALFFLSGGHPPGCREEFLELGGRAFAYRPWSPVMSRARRPAR